MAALIEQLLAEVLRDAYRYAPGLEQYRPTSATPRRTGGAAQLRDRGRDALERAAARAGFHHRHYDPVAAGAGLARIVERADQLESTFARLADERSRRTMLDVLKLRVLGPYHAPLPVTPAAYRALESRVQRTMLRDSSTFSVSDPWFSTLSLFRVPLEGAGELLLHSHAVPVASVFLLQQYGYTTAVCARSRDVVLDVGGCWGDTALYFADRVGPAGKVFTFEFVPENLEILRANLELNPRLAERVEIVERALWDSSEEPLAFRQAGSVSGVIPAALDPDATPVPALTLDEFVAGAGLHRVGFAKLDVEGAEARVLRGGRRMLAEHAPRLAIAAYHHDNDLATLPELVPGADLYLAAFSPLEDETVLFATPRRNST